MKPSIKEFMSNSDLCVYTVDECYSPYKLIKLPYNDRFVYVFKSMNIIDFSNYNNKLELIGLWDNKLNLIYLDGIYLLHNPFGELQGKRIYEIQKDIQQDVNNHFKNFIKKNYDSLKCRGGQKFREFYNYKENYTELITSAENEYLSRANILDMPDVTFNASDEYHYLTKDDLLNIINICKYLEDKDSFLDEVLTKIMHSMTKLRKYSSVSGLPDLELDIDEYLGFKILRNEKIQELINAEAQNIHSLLTKKRNIKTALTLFDTKTVNVTVLHNGNELTFKYPTSSLKNFYISEYNIPDLTIRDKFRKLFSDKYYNDDEIISKIVRITFRNKELYNEALNE